MMRARLGPILAVLLVAEIAVFILVGSWIGVGWTILLALFTSAVGLWLFGREGMRALRGLGEASRGGKSPGAAAIDTGLVALGGLLVFMPGFVSDVVGLMCLMPATRPLIRRLVIGGVARKYGPARVRSRRLDGVEAPRGGGPRGTPASRPADATGSSGGSGPGVIEGEIVP
ncbi:MAG: FxsA family protein [Actinomycetota bacterium]|nr:FxsA family protein [Actinomycetota bacterium]